MNAEEITILMARVQGHDNREITPQNALAWAETLASVPYAYAVQAVQRHFATSDEYLTPGIVLRLAKSIYADERRKAAIETRAAQEDRSEEIRRAALDRKASDSGTRVVTPEEAERYGKRLLDAIMHAVATIPRDRAGRIPKGMGTAAAQRALADFQARYGKAPVVDRPRQPCANPMCNCTHEDPCEAGWIPVDPGDPAAAVAPCPVCKPRASAIVENAKGNRSAAAVLLREQGKKDDEKTDKW